MPVVAGPKARRLVAEREVLDVAVWKSTSASGALSSRRRVDGVEDDATNYFAKASLTGVEKVAVAMAQRRRGLGLV